MVPGLVLQVFGHSPIPLSSNETPQSSCSFLASFSRYVAPDPAGKRSSMKHCSLPKLVAVPRNSAAKGLPVNHSRQQMHCQRRRGGWKIGSWMKDIGASWLDGPLYQCCASISVV